MPKNGKKWVCDKTCVALWPSEQNVTFWPIHTDSYSAIWVWTVNRTCKQVRLFSQAKCQCLDWAHGVVVSCITICIERLFVRNFSWYVWDRMSGLHCSNPLGDQVVSDNLRWIYSIVLKVVLPAVLCNCRSVCRGCVGVGVCMCVGVCGWVCVVSVGVGVWGCGCVYVCWCLWVGVCGVCGCGCMGCVGVCTLRACLLCLLSRRQWVCNSLRSRVFLLSLPIEFQMLAGHFSIPPVPKDLRPERSPSFLNQKCTHHSASSSWMLSKVQNISACCGRPVPPRSFTCSAVHCDIHWAGSCSSEAPGLPCLWMLIRRNCFTC